VGDHAGILGAVVFVFYFLPPVYVPGSNLEVKVQTGLLTVYTTILFFTVTVGNVRAMSWGCIRFNQYTLCVHMRDAKHGNISQVCQDHQYILLCHFVAKNQSAMVSGFTGLR
jgi:hypothetical protein